MPKLNDTQLMLLAHAAKRDSGSVYPLPDSLTGAARATKAIAALIKLGMVEEREVTDAAEVSRTTDNMRYGGCCQSNANPSPQAGARSLRAGA